MNDCINRIAARLFLMVLSGFLVLGSAHAAEHVVTDALSREVRIDSTQKLLTLGSDVSEIVVALGDEDRIIAVDRGSTYPDSLRSKPNVGYRRQTNFEGIVALAPGLVLASEDVATPHLIEMLNAAKIPVVFVKVDNSLEGLREKIRFIAEVLEVQDEGRRLESRVVDDFNAAAAMAASVPMAERKKVIFFHGLLRFTAAGKGTAADAIIGYAGGVNPVTFNGYKSLSEELLLGMAPEAVLMLPDASGGPTAEQVFSNVALRNTPAGKSETIIVLKGAYMINFGPRTADAIRSLSSALYDSGARKLPH